MPAASRANNTPIRHAKGDRMTDKKPETIREELKACPFCGDVRVKLKSKPGGVLRTMLHFVECLNCGATSMAVLGIEPAIGRWNRRYTPSDMLADARRWLDASPAHQEVRTVELVPLQPDPPQ